MVLEMSTGFSGAYARQFTLNQTDIKEDLWNSLELAARQGNIVLEAEGILIDRGTNIQLSLQFMPKYKN